MKTIGILGGMGPESTINYYGEIIKRFREITTKDEYPNIVINSIDMTKMLSYVASNNMEDLVSYLITELNKLVLAGADICAISSNTPHIVFNAIQKKLEIPLISIVESTAYRAKEKELKKILLIGTSFTMKNDFYSEIFCKHDISIVVPKESDQDIIHNIIFPELEQGIVIPEKKLQLKSICNEIISKGNIDSIILGCTELPLMIDSNDFDIEVLDTADIHIDELVGYITG